MSVILEKLLSSSVLGGLVNRVFGAHVTIFTLHRSESKDGAYQGTPPAILEKCLQYAQSHQFQFASVDELVDMARRGERLRRPTLCFTLDDGYQDQLDELVPILLQYKAKPTLYVITDLVDHADWPWDAKLAYIIWQSSAQFSRFNFEGQVIPVDLSTLAGRTETRRRLNAFIKSLNADQLARCMVAIVEQFAVEPPASAPPQYKPSTWSRLREFEAQGLRIGSHGQTHLTLNMLSDSAVLGELMHANARLSAEIANPSRVFCYPSGTAADFSAKHEPLVQQAGFIGAVSCISKTNTAAQIKSGPFHIHRIGFPKQPNAFARYASWVEFLRDKWR